VIINKATPSPMTTAKDRVKNWTKKLSISSPLSDSRYTVVLATRLEVNISMVFNAY